MKVSQLLSIFLSLLILNSSLSTNFFLKTSSNDKKLPNYVCKVTKDIIKSKTDTQDILIANFGGKLWSSTVNDISGCIGNGSAVVISDFKSAPTEKTLKRAAVVILMFRLVNQVEQNVFKHIIAFMLLFAINLGIINTVSGTIY